MTKLQSLLEAANKLWGEGYDYETETDIPAECSPWMNADEETIGECLYQSDETFMDRGVTVIIAAFEYLKEAREKGEV